MTVTNVYVCMNCNSEKTSAGGVKQHLEQHPGHEFRRRIRWV